MPPSLRRIAAASLIAAAAFAFWAAMQPSLALPGHILDKLAHIGTFAVLGALALAASSDRRTLLLGLGGLAALGGLIEIVQYFLPGRESSVVDFLSDIVGITLGTWAARHVIGLWRERLFAR
ncbi:VanZ family protein [Azospirillum sp. sgz301742]